MKSDATHVAARAYIQGSPTTKAALVGLAIAEQAGYWAAVVMGDPDSPSVLARLTIRGAVNVFADVLSE